MTTPAQQAKAERIEGMNYLAEDWAKYEQERTELRAEAMRRFSRDLRPHREELRRLIQLELSKPKVKIVEVAQAMGVNRQTIDALLKGVE